MMDSGSMLDDYILESGEAELERLRDQARTLAPATERLLRQAGLTSGMRCLDAGCGPGEGMRIIGRIVGPAGHVTGIDRDRATGEQALARLRAEEAAQFAFVEGDVDHLDPVPGAPFDLVFARLLLCHMADPVTTLGHLAALVRPGGRLVLMDYDMSRMAVRPEHPAIERGFEILTECFRRSGKDADAGLRLGQYLAAAGLPAPDGYEIEPLFGSVPSIGAKLDSVLASLTAAAAALGIAQRDEVAAIRAEIRACARSGAHTALGPITIGVWTTLPEG